MTHEKRQKAVFIGMVASSLLLFSALTVISAETGWSDYIDTQYTTSSRFTVTNGVVTKFPNNMGARRIAQEPLDINQTGGFYNGTHILGRNGDAYGIAIRFNAEPQSPNTYCQFFYNISGTVGQLPARLLSFPKGAGIEHDVKFYGGEYTLDTWTQNGASVEVLCSGGNVEFWDISYEFFRLHKANSTISMELDGELSVPGISGQLNQVVCVKSDGDLGTCSSAVNASGGCTCI